MKKALMVLLIIANIVMLILIAKPVKDKTDPPKAEPKTTAQKEATETAETAPPATPEELPPAEEPNEEQSNPFYNSIGRPAASDFAFIADVKSGSLGGRPLENDEIAGQWKAEYIFDGVWELLLITIHHDGSLTIQPSEINYGDGWVDESADPSYNLAGQLEVYGVYAYGDYGSMTLHTFVEDYGTQYGVGSFTVQSGETAEVYLIRP